MIRMHKLKRGGYWNALSVRIVFHTPISSETYTLLPWLHSETRHPPKVPNIPCHKRLTMPQRYPSYKCVLKADRSPCPVQSVSYAARLIRRLRVEVKHL